MIESSPNDYYSGWWQRSGRDRLSASTPARRPSPSTTGRMTATDTTIRIRCGSSKPSTTTDTRSGPHDQRRHSHASRHATACVAVRRHQCSQQDIYYWVKATNMAGDSTLASVDSGSRLAAPNAPTSITATMGSLRTRCGCRRHRRERRRTRCVATRPPRFCHGHADQGARRCRRSTPARSAVRVAYSVVGATICRRQRLSAYATGFRDSTPLVRASTRTCRSGAGHVELRRRARSIQMYTRHDQRQRHGHAVRTPARLRMMTPRLSATTLLLLLVQACIRPRIPACSCINSGPRQGRRRSTSPPTGQMPPWTISGRQDRVQRHG